MGRGRPPKCPYCGESGKSVSKGIRRTKTMGDRRIRFCRACSRKFTPKNQKPVQDEQQETPPEGDIQIPETDVAIPTDTP